MPACTVNDENDAFVWASSDRLGKVFKRYFISVLIYRGQNQPLGATRLGMDKSIKINPLVAPFPDGNRAFSSWRPCATQNRN